ncbi:hypothetical protein [Roseivivax sp. CAU 1761]
MLAVICGAPASADAVSDALRAARAAYEAGDVELALDELDIARARLLDQRSNALGRFLPPAPEGWSRQVATERHAGLALMGGGVAAEATYASPDGVSGYTLSLLADNPMVASMAAMIAHAPAMGLEVDRIGRERFVTQDGQVMGLVGSRVLVQIDGASPDLMRAALERIDYASLAAFGS